MLHLFFAAASAATIVIWSNSDLSLGFDTLVIRPFFFEIEATLVAALFQGITKL